MHSGNHLNASARTAVSEWKARSAQNRLIDEYETGLFGLRRFDQRFLNKIGSKMAIYTAMHDLLHVILEAKMAPQSREQTGQVFKCHYAVDRAYLPALMSICVLTCIHTYYKISSAIASTKFTAIMQIRHRCRPVRETDQRLRTGKNRVLSF
jgi:hypothetical protein